jgi:hypothetical protein
MAYGNPIGSQRNVHAEATLDFIAEQLVRVLDGQRVLR